MSKATLILIGGFLGAGKTTLMAQAARRLVAQGKRVGLITNDQADELVDTEMLKQTGSPVKEVAGACFCCKFNDLIEKGDELIAEMKPDIVLSEPVGSCTDLSATVLNPIKKFYAEKFHVAPYSVLVDPSRLEQALSDKISVFKESVFYIFSKQLEEADVIVLNKADTLPDARRVELVSTLTRKFPGTVIRPVSALNGSGVDAWLEAMLKVAEQGGRRIAPIDYDTYAEGEAVLGWLNAAARIKTAAPTKWKDFAFELMRRLRSAFEQRKTEIAHVKIFLNAAGTGLVANLTSTHNQPFVLVSGTSGPVTDNATLIVNARVQMPPDDLKQAVQEVLAGLQSIGATVTTESLECFSPGRPKPTHRLTEVEA
jgi:G3E family GTPase